MCVYVYLCMYMCVRVCVCACVCVRVCVCRFLLCVQYTCTYWHMNHITCMYWHMNHITRMLRHVYVARDHVTWAMSRHMGHVTHMVWCWMYSHMTILYVLSCIFMKKNGIRVTKLRIHTCVRCILMYCHKSHVTHLHVVTHTWIRESVTRMNALVSRIWMSENDDVWMRMNVIWVTPLLHTHMHVVTHT